MNNLSNDGFSSFAAILLLTWSTFFKGNYFSNQVAYEHLYKTAFNLHSRYLLCDLSKRGRTALGDGEEDVGCRTTGRCSITLPCCSWYVVLCVGSF